MEMEEKEIWAGKPSQYINFDTYSRCIFIILLSIPVKQGWSKIEFFQDFHQNDSVVLAYKLLLAAIIIAPMIWAFFAWLSVHCRSYRLTTQRLSETYGILNKVTEDLELYRVKDSTTLKPFSLRMFGLGNIVLMTSDKSTPVVLMEGMRDVDKLQTIVRKYVEIMRTHKGVREID